MANLTNPNRVATVGNLDYFKSKIDNSIFAIFDTLDVDDTGDITIEYDDGTEEEEND